MGDGNPAATHGADVLRQAQEENAKLYAENKRLDRELVAVTSCRDTLRAHLNDIRLLLRAVTER